MNGGHYAICNMELLYSESIFHFGLLYCVPMVDVASTRLGHSLDWCRLNGRIVAYMLLNDVLQSCLLY